MSEVGTLLAVDLGAPDYEQTHEEDGTLTVVTEPGLYFDMPDAIYHGDPVPAELGGSLSHSGAKLLLPPSVPAKFAYQREHGRPPKKAWDFGHAAHQLVLGTGPEIVVVHENDWRKKAAQEAKADAYAEGKVPLLAKDHEVVQAMAAALAEHEIASSLLAEGSGLPEVSAFARDPQTGAMLRCRFDWLPHPIEGQRLIVPDYKTAEAADVAAVRKAVGNHAYFMQAAWYVRMLELLGYAADAAFLFIFQEKEPPFLVQIVELDQIALRIGAARARAAIDLFAQCTEAGRWPGYPAEIELVGLPGWLENTYLQEI